MRAAAAAAFAVLLGAAAPARATPGARPAIAVEVRLEARSLKDLPRRDEVARELAGPIADWFRPRYRLFDWSPGAAGAAPVATLRALVTQTDTSPLPTIELAWLLSVPQQPDFPLPVGSQTIYSSTDMSRALSEPEKFKADFRKAIAAALQEGFDDRFRERAVEQIPIASEARAIARDHTVAIPIRWADAQLGVDALVRVSFERREGDGMKQGHVDLDFLSERLDDPDKGMIQGGVQSAIWGSSTLPLSSGWHEQLPSLLSGSVIQCRVTRYKEGFGSGVGAIQLVP